MSLQDCSYEIGMVNRAHPGWSAGCLAGCCGEKNRPFGYNPLSIPSLCLDSAGHRFTSTIMLLDRVFVSLTWCMDSSFVFALYICAPSPLCVCFSLDYRGKLELRILTRTKTHTVLWVCVRRTGALSVCLSLPVELMFDQGENEREKERARAEV